MYAEGFIFYTTIVICMQVKVLAITDSRTLINWAMVVVSMAGYLFFAYAFGLIGNDNWYGTLQVSMSTGQFWISVAVVPFLFLICDSSIDLLFRYINIYVSSNVYIYI